MSDRANESYGQHGGGTWVDRFGVWLSARAIRRAVPARNGLRVVELGCGYQARHLTSLYDRLAEGVAVDFKLAPELRQWERLTLIEGPIEDALPRLPEARYDVVLLISVLEHLGDAPAALAAIHRVLVPGGLLLVNVPTWRGKFFLELSAFKLGWSPRVEMDDHKMYYDKRDLWPLLVRAGFKPGRLVLRYHKFGLNLFGAATKTVGD
jgi:SAM-dependent methyltransferase